MKNPPYFFFRRYRTTMIKSKIKITMLQHVITTIMALFENTESSRGSAISWVFGSTKSENKRNMRNWTKNVGFYACVAALKEINLLDRIILITHLSWINHLETRGADHLQKTRQFWFEIKLRSEFVDYLQRYFIFSLRKETSDFFFFYFFYKSFPERLLVTW